MFEAKSLHSRNSQMGHSILIHGSTQIWHVGLNWFKRRSLHVYLIQGIKFGTWKDWRLNWAFLPNSLTRIQLKHVCIINVWGYKKILPGPLFLLMKPVRAQNLPHLGRLIEINKQNVRWEFTTPNSPALDHPQRRSGGPRRHARCGNLESYAYCRSLHSPARSSSVYQWEVRLTRNGAVQDFLSSTLVSAAEVSF